MSRRSSVGRLLALSPAERRLLLLAVTLLPCFAVGLRLRGLRGVEGWFRGVKAPPGATPAQATRMVAAAASSAPWMCGCLAAALTLQRILDAQGILSEVRLGVRRRAGGLEAHAWLERDGAAILDMADGREPFAPLLPARRP